MHVEGVVPGHQSRFREERVLPANTVDTVPYIVRQGEEVR